MSHTQRQRADGGEFSVLLLSPRSREADMACEVLRREGFDCMPCHTLGDLKKRMAGGVGAAVIADEALIKDGTAQLLAALDEQPDWSDLPVLILSTPARSRAIARLAAKRSFTVLDRPIHMPMFITVVQAALESRRRQYEVRDLVKNLQTLNSYLEQRTSQLQKLSLELTRTEHRERRRIAAEIHDYLAQMLVVARFKVNQANKIALPQKGKALLEEIDQVLDQSLTYTRTLVAELSPRVLEHAGLPAALQWLAGQMKQHGLDVHVADHSWDGKETDLEEELSIALYQSVRELLLNVVKHARSNRAEVAMGLEATGYWRITVSDEGQGFEASAVTEPSSQSTSFGLFSIRERLAGLGGRLEIDSAPGRGTRVTMVVPIRSSVPPVEPSPSEPQLIVKQAGPRAGPIRVLLVDDHTMVRQGLRELLTHQRTTRHSTSPASPGTSAPAGVPPARPAVDIVGEASNGTEAVAAARALGPDVILMDVNMPQLNGINATREILRTQPHIKVIGLSQEADTRRAILDAGAVMHVDKASAAGELYDAICAVARMEPVRPQTG